MATGMRPTQDYDPETDPEYETALRAYLAAHPADVPNITVRKSAPSGPADVSGIAIRRSAPPPMSAPVAALQSMTDGSTPSRAEQIVAATGDPTKLDALLTPGFKPVGRSTGTVTSEELTPPAPTPEGEAMYRDLLAAGAAGRGASAAATPIPGAPIDPELPNVSMPSLPPAPPAEVPPGLTPPSIRVGKAYPVSVLNRAVAQTADRGPSAPPATAPPASPDPVHRALTAAALSARPPQGDTDLEAALQAAAGRRLVAGLARAGGSMIGRGQGAAYDALDREAEAPVQEYGMRRALSTEAQHQAALQAAADAARRKEAFSEEMGRGELDVKRGELDVKRKAEALKERKGAGGGAGGLKPHEVDQDFQKFGEAISTVHGRSNLNRERQESLDRADRLSALVLGPNGDIANLTPQQLREAATSLAALITKGGPSAVSQIDELVPQTLAAKWANVKQKVLNEPAGADAQAFLRNMLETAGRETKVIKGQIHQGQTQSIPTFAHLKKADPARYAAILKANGLDPATFDDAGLERGAPTANPGAPAASVRMRAPNGKVKLVPADQVEAAKAAGGVVL